MHFLVMDKLRNVLGGNSEPDDQASIMSEVSASVPSLSWSTRIKGFIICFALGVLLSVLGSFFIIFSLVLFAIFYTVGNVLSLASTFFLMGPLNQLKKMFAETRIIAALVMLLFMALTLMSALWWKIPALCVLFCILQYLALTWYSLSYIPFARNAVKGCINSCLE